MLSKGLKTSQCETQTADCGLQTGVKMQTEGKNYTDCRLFSCIS